MNGAKFVFFGTPEFAVRVLEKIIAGGYVPLAVICNPDRPVGRKKITTPPPTKVVAQKHGVCVLQPETLDAEFKTQIINLKPEFGIVAAYAKIIPREVIDLFPRGVIGVHPSLLPKCRGSSPIQSAILGGEEKTGATLYLLDEKMDRGAIIAAREIAINDDDDYNKLHLKLAELGGELLLETLPKFLSDKIKPVPQDESLATYTKKFTTEDAFIDEKDLLAAIAGGREKALAVSRKIRALNPEPGTWTVRIGKRIKLIDGAIENGRLVLKKTQAEGEKAKTVA